MGSEVAVKMRPDEVIQIAALRICVAMTDLPPNLVDDGPVADWLAQDVPHRIELLTEAIGDLQAVVEMLADLQRQSPQPGALSPIIARNLPTDPESPAPEAAKS